MAWRQTMARLAEMPADGQPDWPASCELPPRKTPRAGTHADILILGGGCAGLSLAARLAEPARLGPDQATNQPRVIVLEQRCAYQDDRTFSYWRGAPHPFQACVRAQWGKWRVGSGNRVVECGDDLFPYETIAGQDFYDTAQDLIAAAPWIDLRLGVHTGQSGSDADGVWVDTDRGRVRGELLIDTRPQPPAAGATRKSGLLQVFAGCEVQTERPMFDAGTAELMMFEPPNQDHIGFCYVLPFAADRALLEYTRFAIADTPPPDIDWVESRIAQRLNCAFTVHRTETGTLPMQVLPPAPRGPRRVLRLGTVAGAARASTGYAFGAIQAQAAALACRLKPGWQAALGWQAPVTPRWMQEMDRVFLRVLRAEPDQGPDIFVNLFERCPPANLVRFLSGTGGLVDALAVARALPVAPFLRDIFGGLRA